MTSTVEGPPLVLVVEDKRKSLELHEGLFADVGCTTIGVRSSDDAIRELRASPGVDLVVTDIHLARRREDKSGVALARFVKDTYHDLPVAGYSAVFYDKDLSTEDEEPFDLVWPKGEIEGEGFDEIVARCYKSAMEHRMKRAENAFEAQAVLRRRHEDQHPEVELLRELRLGGGEAAPVEAALSEAGYRLKLVEATVAGLMQPTIVWLLPIDDGIEAEVYGQPALYARGSTDHEAINDVIELMHLYGAEVSSGGPEAIGPALSLTRFLERIGAARKAPDQ
ncbi:MAG TPA: hypothetical protein VFF79_16005 [Conexibacter sp.]|nr:hypothetical protein [Conexibacter sp.]